tara:strand:+ start:1175 stop:2020 length:846 start_codon:yes stop_codon:yes gene_type:complete
MEDYYKRDLKLFIIKNTGDSSNLSKLEMFDKVKGCIYLKRIIMIQSYYRGKCLRKGYDYKGCNNEEDFYTYEKLQDIPKEYFYSYRDSQKIKWGFDIRSLNKLLDMGYNNPYTTEKVPENIRDDVGEKIKILKENNYENIDEVMFKDKRDMVKHRVVDMCSDIERSGFTCLVEWIMNLSRGRVKDLYRIFEDTINYRAQLSGDVKMRIYPPMGVFFGEPMIEILSMTREDILIATMNEVEKFTKCNNESDKKLGYMYFIISLSGVSNDCKETHNDWINFIN